MKESDRSIVLVVPVKPLGVAKSRLAPTLGLQERLALALLLLKRTLLAVHGASVPMEVWVVGGDRETEAIAIKEGATIIEELGDGLNETVDEAFSRAFSLGAQAAIYLPADLPFLAPNDLDALVAASEGLQKLVFAPALRDGGTNAILVPQDIPFHPRLGEESLLRHVELAILNGWRCVFCSSAGFDLDLDTPEDMEECTRRSPSFAQELVRWQTVMARKEWLEALDR